MTYFTLLFSLLSFAQDLDGEFKTMLKKQRIPLAGQAYCYRDRAGMTEGLNTTVKQPIASVTKLYTTLLALQNIGARKRFITRFHLTNDQLHIEGGNDPSFDKEKLLYLIQELNSLGYKSFKEVTFDARFYSSDTSPASYLALAPNEIASTLKKYFNTKVNEKYLKNRLAAVKSFINEDGSPQNPIALGTMSATKVSFSAINPLIATKRTILTHHSRELKDILKIMNVFSKNRMAETLFKASLETRNEDQTYRSLGLDSTQFKLYTGSGMPIKSRTGRLDNWATCEAVLDMLDVLKEKAETQRLDLNEIVGHGQDIGGYKKRFLNNPELKNNTISKTGTINIGSMLSGWLETDLETSFAILNKSTGAANARKFQDLFLNKIFARSGNPLNSPYTRLSVFPLDSYASFFTSMSEVP